MTQVKLTLDQEYLEFLRHHREFGFKSQSAMVRAALRLFWEELERRQLQDSAALYAELYEEDEELQELTEAALRGWPDDAN